MWLEKRNVFDQSSCVYPSDNSLWHDYLSFPMSVIKTREVRKGIYVISISKLILAKPQQAKTVMVF
jgi:hypothetical protein